MTEPVTMVAATDPRVARLLERLNKLPRPELRTPTQEAAYQYLGDLIMLEVGRSSMAPEAYRKQHAGLVLALASLKVEG